MENQETQYEITTHTGKHALAGTDATVYIQIEGEKGSLNEMPLDGNGKNPFERGQQDTFVLTGKDIGKITKVSVRHDNTNKDAGWHLESIRIKSATHPELGVQFFRCNKWLTEKELSVELQPAPLPDHLK